MPSTYVRIKRHRMHSLALNPTSSRYLVRSRYQYLPQRVVPYIDITSRTGTPQYFRYSGNKIPLICGMVTNILVRILACRNAPMKSDCLTLALIRLAWARNILRLQNEVVGDHLSSVIFLSCKSPLTTNLHLSLSNDPSLFTFTLKVSIMGVLVSPEFRVSGANVPESIIVLSSF